MIAPAGGRKWRPDDGANCALHPLPPQGLVQKIVHEVGAHGNAEAFENLAFYFLKNEKAPDDRSFLF